MSEDSPPYTATKGKAIAAIDPDTKAITIVILADKGEPFIVSRRAEAVGRRADDRFLDLTRHLRDVLCIVQGCSWVYVERPMVGPNRKAAIDMGMIVGMIRDELDRLNMPHSLVDPGVWKKALLGNGHATKDEIKEWAIRHLGMADGQKQDFYDAACIAAYGLRPTERRRKCLMDKKEVEALKEGVAKDLEAKGEHKLAALVRRYGVVGAFDRVLEETD